MDLLAHWKEYEESRDAYIVAGLRGGATVALRAKHDEMRERFAAELATAQGAVEENQRLREFIASRRDVRFEARVRGLITVEEYVDSLRNSARGQ